MNTIEVRKVGKADECWGTHGRYHKSSARYGVFLNGKHVADLQNQGGGSYMEKARWTMEFVDESGRWQVTAPFSAKTLEGLKGKIPRMLALAGLVTLPDVQVNEKLAQRVGGNVAVLAADVQNLLRK